MVVVLCMLYVLILFIRVDELLCRCAVFVYSIVWHVLTRLRLFFPHTVLEFVNCYILWKLQSN